MILSSATSKPVLLVCLLGCYLALASLSAASGVPNYEPEKWNQAFKVSVSNLTKDQEDNFYMGDCQDDGFDSDPKNANVNDCFYKQQDNGTYSYWVKGPGDWLDDSNCYCYALNVYKGGFCSPPGLDGELTCDVMRKAVIADGAKEVTRDEALKGQPSTGHYIALMTRNTSCNPYHCWENDYHAARKDSNGQWSWKEPAGPVFDTDLFGDKITDPEKQIMYGHYDNFCGYFNVFPDMMKIDGDFSEATVQDEEVFYEYTYPGAVVWVEPLPYNAATDGALSPGDQMLFEQDQLWESKRGTKEWNDFYSGGSDSHLKGARPMASMGHRKLLH